MKNTATFFCRTFVVAISLLFSGINAHATAWTTTGAGALTSLSSWTDGVSSPASFTTPGDTWTINHIMSMSSSAPWTVGTAAAAPATVTINTGGRISGSSGGFQMILNIYGNLTMNDSIRVNGGSCRLRVNVYGNLNIASGAMFSSGGGAMLYALVAGDMNMTGGSIYANGATCMDTVEVRGDFNMSGTSFITASGASAAGTVLLTMRATLTDTAHISNTSTGTWGRTNVYVADTAMAKLSGNFSTTTGAASNGLIVRGWLQCPAAYTVNGTGIFSLMDTAYLTVAHMGGINAAITTSGTLTFSPAASYEFNGTVTQLTGTYLPANLVAPSQLMIKNTSDVALTGTTTTTGKLVFLSYGRLDAGSSSITVPGAPGAVTGAGAFSYVVGALYKTITGYTTLTFEVGDINAAFMQLTLSSPGTGGRMGVQTYTGLHTAIASSGILSTAIANHYWRIFNLSATGPATYIPRGTYNAVDIIGGSNATFATQRYEGGAWLPAPLPSANTVGVPYTTAPISGIALPALPALPVITAEIIYGNTPCVTTPITGTATVCPTATTTLANTTPGGTWSSSAPTIATVSSSGVVTGLLPGTTVIAYTAGSCAVTMVVTVMAGPDPGTITGVPIACIGLTTNLSGTVPGGTWSSVTPAIATVTSSGVVTGITAGTTIISYTVTGSCGIAAATVVVTVSTSLSVAPITGADSVCVGNTIALSCATGGGAWTSFNTSLATVTAIGMVTGVATGIDTIYYTITNSCGTAVAKKVVKVKPAGTCPTTGISLSMEEPKRLQVFPNPNTGSFTLSLAGITEDALVIITDVTRRTVGQFTIQPNNQKAIKLHQPAGLYMVTATTQTERFYTKVRIE